MTVFDLLFYALLVACLIGILYLGAATLAVRQFAARPRKSGSYTPAVTVLKPLCGVEPGLYDNLRSFCEQDYPEHQIVFGAHPVGRAAQVVRKLMDDLPHVDIALTGDGQVRGPNRKIGNLEYMMREARHDVLVIADSDIRVGPDYLKSVVAPLAGADVGLVTCLFTGRPGAGIWSRLASMWINYGFLPSVLVARAVGARLGCFGSTMVLRRSLLEQVGGFASLREQLADDHELGAAVRRRGKAVVISSYVVESAVPEASLRDSFLHELRWGRTIRSVAPVGHVASVVMHPLALAVLGLMLPGYRMETLLVVGLALALRLVMIAVIDRSLGLRSLPVWMVPARDVLSLVIYVASLRGGKVVWRSRSLRVAQGGRLVADEGPS